MADNEYEVIGEDEQLKNANETDEEEDVATEDDPT